jgi:hypothetical protein
VTDPFRVYDAVGPDGYPPEWHATIKHLVREQADHRCVRCHHPYRNGEHGNGEWSACDESCAHGGPVQLRHDGFRPQFIPADSRTFNAGRQLVYDRDTTCIDPATGRVLPPLVVVAQWRILTVHHLDGDKANCRWWNLAALCQRCHLTIQGRVQLHRVWPWEHSDWFKPYAAGWYARSYLAEDLDREEVDARLDELLALERAA